MMPGKRNSILFINEKKEDKLVYKFLESTQK